MRKAIIIASTILLTLNLTLGMVLSSYDWFNVATSSGVIILTAVMSLLANKTTIKNGFKVSLFIVFSIVGLIEYFLAVLMPSSFTDNWLLIGIIILVGVEAVILSVASIVSEKIK